MAEEDRRTWMSEWKLVPVIATEAMAQALNDTEAKYESTPQQEYDWLATARAMYANAIAAAPAAPAQEPVAHWLLYFEDADRRPEIFTDEAGARTRFADCSHTWACHLFKSAAPAPAVAAQGDELPPLPDPLWWAIDTPGADVDVTFVTTKGEAIECCEHPDDIDKTATKFYSADQMHAYARAALAGRGK
jgi:hypothetical protein